MDRQNKATKRDKVWLHVIDESMRNGNVVTARSVSDSVDVSRKTAREVLKVMEYARLIRERSTNRTVEYHPEYKL